MKKYNKSDCKGELKCDFVTDNFDEIWNFWKRKENSSTTKDELIPKFLFSTNQDIDDGCYWFELEGYRFTNCWIEIIGWGEGVICQSGSYIFERI